MPICYGNKQRLSASSITSSRFPIPHPVMPGVGRFQGQVVEPQKASGQRLGVGMGVTDGVIVPGSNGVTQLDLGMEREP